MNNCMYVYKTNNNNSNFKEPKTDMTGHLLSDEVLAWNAK